MSEPREGTAEQKKAAGFLREVTERIKREGAEESFASLREFLKEHAECRGATTLVDGSGLVCTCDSSTWTLPAKEGT